MTYVTVNVMTVPPARADEFVQRFADRPRRIEHADGFERFELLRPADGWHEWLVMTLWRDRSAYEKWSQERTPRADSVADKHELWAFQLEHSSVI